MDSNGISAVVQPMMEGANIEVQHSYASGKPYTAERGLWGVGVVTMPNGQPRIIMQVKHADGTSLSMTLKSDDMLMIVDSLIEAAHKSDAIAAAADSAVRQ